MLTTMINTKLTILRYPHEILLTPSQDIDITGEHKEQYLEFISKMMDIYNGKSEWGMMVGLAAPQVGQNWNVFIALNQVYINPKVEINLLKGYSNLSEGCYSLKKDKFDYPVRRAYEIKMTWQDVNGTEHKSKFRGRDAQVIQHEYDHLNGILCINHGFA